MKNSSKMLAWIGGAVVLFGLLLIGAMAWQRRQDGAEYGAGTGPAIAEEETPSDPIARLVGDAPVLRTSSLGGRRDDKVSIVVRVTQ